MKDAREVRDMIERAGRYATNGSAAVKVQERPQKNEPLHKQNRNLRQQKTHKQERKGVLQNAPALVKAELIATVVVVALALVGLLVMEIKVASVTASNNAIIRDIDTLEAKTDILREQTDAEISMDEVNAVIESEGLVHPQANTTSVNP